MTFQPLDRVQHKEYPDITGEVTLATPRLLIIQLDSGETTEGEPGHWLLLDITKPKANRLNIKRKS